MADHSYINTAQTAGRILERNITASRRHEIRTEELLRHQGRLRGNGLHSRGDETASA